MHLTRDEDQRATALSHNPLPASKGAMIPAFIDSISSDADPTTAAIREFDLIRVIAAADAAHNRNITFNIEYDT